MIPAMLVDARELADAETRSADLCIVGGGAAGIAIARELAHRGVSVILLESGGLDYEDETQDLYRGQESGRLLRENKIYLTTSRLRYFGGTTNHWTGWCRPLDPGDFEDRPWIAGSGWPFPFEDLLPFYKRAAELVEIEDFDYPLAERATGGRQVLLAESPRVETRVYHYSPPTRLAQKHRELFESAPRLTLLLHANLTKIEVNAAGTAVERVTARTLEGTRVRVEAKHFVLATGGVENARILLNQSSGLGNRNDLVGRFFVDHPHVHAGYAVLSVPRSALALYQRHSDPDLGHDIMGAFFLSEETQREHELQNVGIQLYLQDLERAEAFTRDLAESVLRLDSLGREAPEAATYALVYLRSEQTPNPESRVTLAEETDALGLRRARLDWHIQPRDRDGMRRSLEILARELGRFSLGRMQIFFEEDGDWPTESRGGDHHVGTTRMHRDPKQGVVDENCRVHGVENLFIAGSSVFPTSGAANPTLTLLALSLRLADRLRDLLGV